jgi:hypothetical protein
MFGPVKFLQAVAGLRLDVLSADFIPYYGCLRDPSAGISEWMGEVKNILEGVVRREASGNCMYCQIMRSYPRRPMQRTDFLDVNCSPS